MRIVLISDWFSESMGYSENCLPKALAALGHDVHLVTSNAQPYFDTPGYRETYEPFIGPGVVATGVKPLDGYMLHRLPHARRFGRLRIQGLRHLLAELHPEIVQTFETFSLTTLEAAFAQSRLGYKLFLESHVHASVFDEAHGRRALRRLKWSIYRRTAGLFVSHIAVKCYPISPDAARIAVGSMGMAKNKVEICPLGVDTDLFRPMQSAADRVIRSETRSRLGYEQSDIICIYTGRLSPSKGPQVLAEAIELLRQAGEPFRALFVGGGTASEIAGLRHYPGSSLIPFVRSRDLPSYYWAADIGVWPRQESTSQLDAAACGLPIILSSEVTVRERTDGNGLTYAEGDPASLATTIRELRSQEVRRQMGDVGAVRMQTQFSWRRIAENRVEDYGAVIGANRG